jgi:hypothetical protein
MSVVRVHGNSTIDQVRLRQAGRAKRTIRLNGAREVAIIGLAAYIYFFVRGLIETRVAEAMDNSHWLVSLEERLGLFREATLQGWIVGHDWLVTLANAVYIYGHWPVVIGTLTWLLVRHRELFPVYRSAMLVSGAIGIVVFILFPMAPPRFLPELGFIDTVTLQSEAYRVLQPPSLTNQYAAMPSLHVGWNLLMGIAIFSSSTHRFWKGFAVVMPLLMYIATIVTANHYLLDGVVGSAVALVGLTIAWKLSGPQAVERSTPSIAPPMSPLYTLRR